jgi:hypothetical protein
VQEVEKTIDQEIPEDERAKMVSSTLAIIKQVNETKSNGIYKSLLDPGGSNVMVKRSSLPKGIELLPTNQTFTTTATNMASQYMVYLHDVILPEFNYSRRIKTVKAYVFDNEEVKYDIIFGRDFLNTCRIDICGSDLTCKWYGDTIPFHKPNFFEDNERIRPILTIPPKSVQQWESNTTTALSRSVNTKADIQDVVNQQVHLTEEQC